MAYDYTMSSKYQQKELRSWAPVPNKPTVSVDVKQHSTNYQQINEELIRVRKASHAHNKKDQNRLL